MKTNEKCKNPKCKKIQFTRGLCTNCYQTALRFVRNGKTTWEKLEESGKCVTKGNQGRRLGKTATWFIA